LSKEAKEKSFIGLKGRLFESTQDNTWNLEILGRRFSVVNCEILTKERISIKRERNIFHMAEDFCGISLQKSETFYDTLNIEQYRLWMEI
jgi:hypothetical protein